MYKSSEGDGKYVAEILSSLANGDRAPSISTGMNHHGFYSGGTTATSPTLTPTTLSNIERHFMDLQSNMMGGNSNDIADRSSGYAPQNVQTGSSAEQSPSSSLDQNYSDNEWTPSEKRQRISDGANSSIDIYSMSSQRKSRRNKDEMLSIEEEQRRHVRRERNKVAAAKCRQRRVDHTNKLITETEHLQNEQGSLEAEINKLQQQKDELEFVLQAHKPLCKAERASHADFLNASIKTEFPDIYTTKCTSAPIKCGSNQYTSTMRPVNPIISTDLTVPRPSTLSFAPSSSSSLSSAVGISITTPSSGFFNFSNIDGFVEGSTGLTPMNSNPCGRELTKRMSSESSSPDGGLSSPSLITLG